jgi:CPA2 family monovalent cation:H+ antiporter-2
MDATGPAIFEIGLVLLAAVFAGWVARRLGLPAVIGYLVVGLAVSPFTPGYIADRENLQLLADLGVVLLLFEVGIEVNPERLGRDHGLLVLAAPLQVAITTAVSGAAFFALGVAPISAAVLGLCVALSSSVVIANMTRSVRRTTDADTESTLLGWGILQDLTGVILAAILLSVVGGHGRGLVLTIVGLLAFGVVSIAVARIVLPLVLRAVSSQQDFFLIVSVASGFALAGAGSVVFGVPLALAAFVGGLAVAESPESAEARRRLMPFRDLLAVLFFVAIGSLVDPAALARGVGWLILIVALIVAGKILVSYAILRAARLPSRPLQTAIGLGQIGEFSFVLASALVAAGVLAGEIYAALLTAAAVSIGLSSVLVRVAGPRGAAVPPSAPAPEARGTAA